MSSPFTLCTCFVMLYVFLPLNLARSYTTSRIYLSIEVWSLHQLEWFFSFSFASKQKLVCVCISVCVRVCPRGIDEYQTIQSIFRTCFFFCFFKCNKKKKRKGKENTLSGIYRSLRTERINYLYISLFFTAICVSLEKHHNYNDASHIGFEIVFFFLKSVTNTIYHRSSSSYDSFKQPSYFVFF